MRTEYLLSLGEGEGVLFVRQPPRDLKNDLRELGFKPHQDVRTSGTSTPRFIPLDTEPQTLNQKTSTLGSYITLAVASDI